MNGNWGKLKNEKIIICTKKEVKVVTQPKK